MAAHHYLLAIIDETPGVKIEDFNLGRFKDKIVKPNIALIAKEEDEAIEILVSTLKIMMGSIVLKIHAPNADKAIQAVNQALPSKVDASEIVLFKKFST